MNEIFWAELIGTAILVFLGTSTSAAVTLKKSAAEGSGWVFIALGWGFAVMAGAVISIPISGGHLNPAVSFAFFLQGDLTLSVFLMYVVAQIIGALIGAFLTYQAYFDYFKTNDDGDLVTIFATLPGIKNTARNYLSEILGTFLLVLFILGTTLYTDLAPIFVPLLVVGIGISIGGLTGYAINPARDLGPRIIYALFVKVPNKGSAHFEYQHVPIIGPLVGSGLAVLVFNLCLI